MVAAAVVAVSEEMAAAAVVVAVLEEIAAAAVVVVAALEAEIAQDIRLPEQ